MRSRLCIQPVAASCRMAASTSGNPVRASRQAAKCSSVPGHAMASYSRRNAPVAACGWCHRTWK